MNMIREVSAMEVRKNFGELLNEVKYRHDSLVIKKGGKPIAAIIDIDLFEKIKLLKRQFIQLTTELGQAYKDIPPQIAEEEIAEALAQSKEQND